ncbi:MAG: sugar phosphate isomerase/epimerase family protein [Armatimonadota bacterium]
MSAAAIPLLGASSTVARSDAAPYGPFKMGVQSYSLRNFDRDKMLQAVAGMGLKYLEAFNSHFPVTQDAKTIGDYRKALDARGIELLAFGVVGFGKDAGRNRALFEYAKAMGIETLTANPTPEAMNQLESLTGEFGINIAIHNHGPGARFDKIKDAFDAVSGRSERIGVCIDTGHYIRSDEDPVHAIRVFTTRVHAMHVKDVTSDKKPTELGKGALDLKGMLQALKEIGFRGVMALEYEEHPDDPVPYMNECLAAIRKAVADAGL